MINRAVYLAKEYRILFMIRYRTRYFLWETVGWISRLTGWKIYRLEMNSIYIVCLVWGNRKKGVSRWKSSRL